MEVTPKSDKLNPALSSPYSDEPGPSGVKKEPQPKLSASLRERLKRTRRCFVPPASVAKRLCVNDVEEGRHAPAASKETDSTHNVDANREEQTESEPGSEKIDIEQLRKEVKEKTETLRRLKMVKMYREKNDLTQLQTLIDKWRSCAQAALYELQSILPVNGRKASLSELIDLFGLEDGILHFDRENDDFDT